MRQETAAGLFITAFGAAAVWLSLGHRIGTATNMGAGFFPLLIAILILATGLVVLAGALLARGGEVFGRIELRPMLVLAAMIAFALLIRPVGFVAASAAAILVSGVADPDNRPAALAGLAATLILGGWLIFIQFLGAPMRLWPAL